MCVIASGYAAYYLDYYYRDSYTEGFIFITSVMVIIFVNNYLLGRFELYGEKSQLSNLNIFLSVIKAGIIQFLLLNTFVITIGFEVDPRTFILIFTILTSLSIIMMRFMARFLTRSLSAKRFHSRQIVIVGSQERRGIVTDLLKNQLSWGHDVIGFLALDGKDLGQENVIGMLEDLPSLLKSRPIDEVVFALNADVKLDFGGYLDLCRKTGTPVRILPSLWSPAGPSVSVEHCQNIPFITFNIESFDAHGLLYKRGLDILGGLVGFIILVVIYPFIAVAIKLDSPGPVIFSQKRKGKHGRTFNLYKFRTMGEDAEKIKRELLAQNEMGGLMFKIENDPRITRVGKWLRKTSLDEFPQFINVLKGEMSLVGTRPPTLDEVEKYQTEHLKRIAAKPGITGMWQVSGRNKITDFEKVVALDCKYLDDWHFVDDLKILLKTVWVILLRKGAA